MKYYIPILLFVFIALSFSLHAQKWIDQMDAGVDFRTIQEDFHKDWEGREYKRGKGYKQFKRWEYFMEPRLYPKLKELNRTALWEEMATIYRTKGNNSLQKSNLNWTPIGPSQWQDGSGWNPGNGRVNVVYEDPNNSNKIYIGVPSGGCWRSLDAGSTWTNLTDNSPVLGVSGIAIENGNSNVIYIATGDGDGFDTYSIGVLKSIDGGATWNTTGLSWGTGAGVVTRRLIMDPNDNNILFAATNTGLFKTTDGGANWTNVQSGSIQDVELHPSDPNIVYACSDRFYQSTDGGNTFTEINAGLPAPADINRYKMAVSPDEADYVYLVAGNSGGSDFNGLYRSTNAGNSFSLILDSPNIFGYETDGSGTDGQSWYDLALAVNPNDGNDVVIGGINVWRYLDFYNNDGILDSLEIMSQWTSGNSIGYVHADIHDLAYFGNNLYCGSDGLITKSTDNGENWTDLTQGIAIMQFYEIAISSSSPNLVIGGSQDNGTNVYFGNDTWVHGIGADGMNCQINSFDDNILYGAIQNGGIYKSTNGGNSFSFLIGSDNFSESGAWVTPYELDPIDPNTIYVGYNNIHKSTDNGTSWTSLTSFAGTNSTMRVLKIAPSDNNYIYAIQNNNTFYKSSDAGTTWTNIGSGLPNLSYTDIAIDPSNPQRLWVSLSGYNSNEKVYYSGNGGNTWSNYSAGLPNIPANTIEYFPGSADGLFIGMDIGVYYIDNSLADWQTCFNGLPQVVVNDIEIGCNYSKIRVGTYGRGAWEADLMCPSITQANLVCNGLGDLDITDDIVNISNLEISNVGTVNAGSFDVGFYLSTDETFTTADYLLGINTVSTLNAGANINLNFTADILALHPSLAEGIYYIGYIVDQNNTVDEVIEIDNDDCSWSNPPYVLCYGDNYINISILLDDYPSETTWEILDTDGNAVASGGSYNGQSGLVTETICLPNECFDFTIFDSYGDGICCGLGAGNYSITDAIGNSIVNGGEFGASETTSFCLDNCLNEQSITGTVASDTYQVSDFITSDGLVPSPNVVVYQAGNYIDLTSNFEVEFGAEFTAEILGCSSSIILAPNQLASKYLPFEDRDLFQLKKSTQAEFDIAIFNKEKRNAVVEMNLIDASDVVINLYNLNRKNIGTIDLKGIPAKGVYSLKLDTSTLASGVYFVQVNSGKTVKSQRLIIE